MEGSQPNCGISQRRGEVAADYQYSVSLLYIHQTDNAKSSKCTVVADVMQKEEDTLTKVLKDIRTNEEDTLTRVLQYIHTCSASGRGMK